MHVDMFFDHYFNFHGIKTEINKRLNLTDLQGSEALETKIWYMISNVTESF